MTATVAAAAAAAKNLRNVFKSFDDDFAFDCYYDEDDQNQVLSLSSSFSEQ